MMNHHYPARASFVHGVHGITGALLLDEKTLRLCNSPDEPFELTICVDCREKVYATDTSDIAFHLAYRGPQESCAKCNLDPGSSLIANRADFACIPIKHGRDNRKYCIDRKINRRVVSFRLLGDIARCQMNELNVAHDFRSSVA